MKKSKSKKNLSMSKDNLKYAYYTYDSLEEALTGQDIFVEGFHKRASTKTEYKFITSDILITDCSNKFVVCITYIVDKDDIIAL